MHTHMHVCVHVHCVPVKNPLYPHTSVQGFKKASFFLIWQASFKKTPKLLYAHSLA